MNKTVRLLTDVVAGFSVTTWVSGFLFEEYGLKPVLAQTTRNGVKEGFQAASKAYSSVALTGLMGLALTNTFKFFFDDLRKNGTSGYKRWARIGDLVVLSIIAVSVAQQAGVTSDSATSTSTNGILSKVNIGLSTALLWASASLYKERANSYAKQN